MIATPAVQVCLIAFFSIASQWMGWRFRVPSIVFLLLSGFIFGSAYGFIQPEVLTGQSLQPFISIAVAIILFEGSLTLNFREIKREKKMVWQLVYIGAPVAWVLTACTAHYLGGLSWPTAIPLGALLIVTGPTVIIPLLRNARLNTKIGSILKWEGIVNDPVGAVLAILAYEYFKYNTEKGISLTDFALGSGVEIILISLFSAAVGLLISMILNRGYVPEFLKSIFLLAVVICIFVVCNIVLHESGLIAVTILGIVMANKDITSIEDLRRFKESITILLVSGVFIILTSQIEPSTLLDVDLRGILFVVVLLFVVRPISTFMSSIGTGLTLKEIAIVSYIAPRGVVCAAIAGIMGPLLVESGYPDGAKLLPLAFMIVLVTVFLHGLTAKPLAQKLGLAHPAKDGLIVVGAMKWTLQFANVLKERGIDVMLADKEWAALKEARLNDIPIYYGEILSEETEHILEMNKYNTLLSATGNSAYNALVCNKFGHEFSRERVFQLSINDEGEHERQQITTTMRGRTLAYEGMDCWDFERLYQQGWRFKATNINADFNLDTIKEQKKLGKTKLIGFITQNKTLHFSDAENPKGVKDGVIAILFRHAEEDEMNKQEKKIQDKKDKTAKKENAEKKAKAQENG